MRVIETKHECVVDLLRVVVRSVDRPGMPAYQFPTRYMVRQTADGLTWRLSSLKPGNPARRLNGGQRLVEASDASDAWLMPDPYSTE